MSNELKGTTALVTGGATGIGRATALQLAERGAHVALLGRREGLLLDVAKEIASTGGQAFAVSADVTDADAAADAVERVVRETGRLDILVNSAGTASLDAFATSERGSWQSMIDANLSGVINVSHAAIGHLLAAADDSPRGVADLVTVSSVVGRRSAPVAGVYSATKHAVGAWSESLRQEVATRNVRVALIEPGFVTTPLTAGVPGSETFLHADDISDAIEYMVTRPARASISELLIRPTTHV